MMRKRFLPILPAILLAGCQYEAPIADNQGIPIDTAVLGLWEPQPEGDQKPDPNNRMLILKYSDTEYLIHYPMGEDSIYYRGYPIKPGGVSCVQLEVIGTWEGPPGAREKKLYQVVNYAMKDGKLEVRTLNSDLFEDRSTTAELKQTFLDQKDNPNLFRDPGIFRKVAK